MLELALAWLPALLLVAALLLGHHPGEAVLDRLRPARRRPRRIRARARTAPAEPVRHTAGGLLLARSLAKRPPPAAAR